MKAAKAWCALGLLVLTGFSASCGKEEGTGKGTGGSGSILDGGEGGTNAAGTRMMGGSSGSGGGSVGQSKVGSGCVNDSQCEDPTAPGLICVTAQDTVLGNGAPPKGVCTAECVLVPDEPNPCAIYGDAICYPYDNDTGEGYCLEACSFGEPGIGEIKCHNRGEFSCHPALTADTGAMCTSTDDCDPGELCFDTTGTCHGVFPACLPSCRGDLDCEPGMFCDQSFLNGVCVTEQPTGKALGEPCTVVPDDQPAEPDECIGFCQADSATGTTGRCQTACGIGNECGWNAATEQYDGVCFYASVLTVTIGDIGDFGFCTPSCDCSGDCNDADLACTLLPQGELPDGFRGAGLCFSPNLPEAEGGGRDPDFVEYNQCTGAGGEGGGAPTGEAGAPAASGGGGAGG